MAARSRFFSKSYNRHANERSVAKSSVESDRNTAQSGEGDQKAVSLGSKNTQSDATPRENEKCICLEIESDSPESSRTELNTSDAKRRRPNSRVILEECERQQQVFGSSEMPRCRNQSMQPCQTTSVITGRSGDSLIHEESGSASCVVQSSRYFTCAGRSNNSDQLRTCRKMSTDLSRPTNKLLSDFAAKKAVSCTICLQPLQKARAGIGQLRCGHLFCFVCIQEWLKVSSTCPLCKTPGTEVGFKRSISGTVVSTCTVKAELQQQEAAVNDQFQVVCGGCGSADAEDLLLLCDGCEAGCFHTFCLDPPLSAVPAGRWYCSTCQDERASPVDVLLDHHDEYDPEDNGGYVFDGFVVPDYVCD